MTGAYVVAPGVMGVRGVGVVGGAWAAGGLGVWCRVLRDGMQPVAASTLGCSALLSWPLCPPLDALYLSCARACGAGKPAPVHPQGSPSIPLLAAMTLLALAVANLRKLLADGGATAGGGGAVAALLQAAPLDLLLSLSQ